MPDTRRQLFAVRTLPRAAAGGGPDAVLGRWFRRRMAAERAWNLAGAAGQMLAGAAVLFVAFWVAYGVIWLVSSSLFPLVHLHPFSHVVRLVLSGGFVVLVVIVGARENWEDLDPLGQQARLARDWDITLVPEMSTTWGMNSMTNAVKAEAFRVRSVASGCNAILCSGAKCLLASVQRLRRFRRLRAVDAEGCARVIELLAAAGTRLSFTAIVQQLPGLNPVKVFDDLRYVEGILFLAADPPGLTLHPDLRSELSRLGLPTVKT